MNKVYTVISYRLQLRARYKHCDARVSVSAGRVHIFYERGNRGTPYLLLRAVADGKKKLFLWCTSHCPRCVQGTYEWQVASNHLPSGVGNSLQLSLTVAAVYQMVTEDVNGLHGTIKLHHYCYMCRYVDVCIPLELVGNEEAHIHTMSTAESCQVMGEGWTESFLKSTTIFTVFSTFSTRLFWLHQDTKWSKSSL